MVDLDAVTQLIANFPGGVPRSDKYQQTGMGGEFVTSRAEEYRRYARQCSEIAPAFQDEEARATLLRLAQAWSRLALTSAC